MTAPLPTPADIPVGHVVRVRLGGYVYTGTVESPGAASLRANELQKNLESAAHRDGGFVSFACADGRLVRIKARAISAIESGPPPAHRDHRTGTSVHVHLYPSASSVDSEADSVGEFGLSTAQVLSARSGGPK